MLQLRQNGHDVWNMFRNSLEWKALIWTMQQTPDVLGFSLFDSLRFHLRLDGKSHLKLVKCCEWGRVLGSEGSAYCSAVTRHRRSNVADVCLFCQGYIYLPTRLSHCFLWITLVFTLRLVLSSLYFSICTSNQASGGGLKCLLGKQKEKEKQDCNIKVFPVISEWAQGWKSMRDWCDSIRDS